MEGRKNGKYRNPCLTMHQPWASLLVHGIKRIEGRSWPSPIRGRLWIHAASKVPDEATVKAMEDFYREIYDVNGITDLKFPQHYPVSRLIGCIEVVGCLRRDELACWNEVPESVRLEALTDCCWLCEHPHKLIVPIEMRGFHGVYNLETKIYEAAVKDLVPVESLQLVKFQLPNPHDTFSLKPGSVSAHFPKLKASDVEKSVRLGAAIDAACAAATQFSKKDQNVETTALRKEFPHAKSVDQNIETNGGFKSRNTKNFTRQWQLKSNSFVEHKMVADEMSTRSENKGNSSNHKEFLHAKSVDQNIETNGGFKSRNSKNFTRQWQLKSNSFVEHKMVADEVSTRSENEGNSSKHDQFPHAKSGQHPGPHSKIFAAAVRGLRPA